MTTQYIFSKLQNLQKKIDFIFFSKNIFLNSVQDFY